MQNPTSFNRSQVPRWTPFFQVATKNWQAEQSNIDLLCTQRNGVLQ